MALSPEVRRRLHDMRMRQIMSQTFKTGQFESVRRKPAPKIRLRKVGSDAPGPSNWENLLRKTCKIVPPGSPIEQMLRESQQLQSQTADFLAYAKAMLREIESHGLYVFFFTLKGVSSYPFVHCANLNDYGERPEEFYAALDAYIVEHPDMFYDPQSYRPITDAAELERIFTNFSEHDRLLFRQVMKNILRKAPHYRQLDFVGHDRSR